jgi:hypothetical protein
MSLAIVDTPQPFQPVLSDGLYFTLSSSTYDASTTFKFRYVYELFVEGQLVFEGKCSPNPFGLGIVDLQQVLESYTNSLPVSYWNTTPIYAHQTFPFSRPASEETIAYQIVCGYEYASSEIAGITGFTGNGNQIGQPAVDSEIYKTFRSTMGTNPRATQQDFNISPFVLSGTPVGIYPTTSGLFLTNAPRIMDVSPEDYFVLGFTNYYLNSGTTPTLLSEPYYVEYKYFDDSGSLISTEQYDNILSNGGGPRTSGCDVYPALYIQNPWTGTNYNTLFVGAGPANLPNLPANCVQYTVQLFGKFTGTTQPIQPTPTPTPSGLPPRETPTMTPTPSVTPFCPNCDRYTIEYTGLSSFGLVNYTNCDTGALESFRALPTVIYVVCSCDTPVGADCDIINIGPCNVTPTPTPTLSCICEEYLVENQNDYTSYVEYIDCSGNPQVDIIPGFSQITICACQGTIEAQPGVDVSLLGPCVTPTPTRTPQPTPTPSSTPPEYEYYYLVRDCDDPLTQQCFASNTFFPTGRIVKSNLVTGCWEILDFCSAPEDAVITLSYLSCEVCPR